MSWNTIILGAGAAGMMCAIHAGPDTLVLDHAKNPGEKIRIAGGGRCNFTNIYASPENFLSENPHFCKSALSRYTQWDFIELVQKHGIPYHEKTLGQLFCDNSSKDIIQMLLAEMRDAGAELRLKTSIQSVSKTDAGFAVETERDGKRETLHCRNLVIATGGKSIPKMGATGLAYDIAQQFGLNVLETRAGLVPFTFPDGRFKPLSGVAHPVRATANHTSFDEALLFTHRGLSGPSMLQISSYWRESQPIAVNFFPEKDIFEALKARRKSDGRKNIATVLGYELPAKLADHFASELKLTGNLADQSDAQLRALSDALTNWQVTPAGTEGYRTAEVTLGGIDTDALSSKTMEAKTVPGLYAIGEAVDVTGWLGGYNFQWAWSSGFAAGTAIRAKSL
ncbi:NAD(P)/FAD-dependent oxidoreductase [Cognatishimia activa]|uniref:Flavoprotein, family n=1 Tax=Cognatishimia activa TaxID=1715691 RepID=A0A0P1IPH7_9RHOB|nr:NAD(P)/FAD-dependent oxidoreductase [Cognatishimia activa]CUJ19905.1 flavoprotein, family [Cognatishimia activa]CUK25519.1 flavoprotein, family [Cognatishimia activa]